MLRVLDRAVPRVLARDAPGELVQVRLADDDRTGGHETLDGGGRARGDVVGVDAGAVRRADACGVEEVLHEQSLAVQQARRRRGRLDVGDHGIPGVGHEAVR